MDTDYYPYNTPIRIGDHVEILREPTKEEHKEWRGWIPQLSNAISTNATVLRDRGDFYTFIALLKLENGEVWNCPKYLLGVRK